MGDSYTSLIRTVTTPEDTFQLNLSVRAHNLNENIPCMTFRTNRLGPRYLLVRLQDHVQYNII